MTASTAPTQPPDKCPADGLDIDDWMVLAQHYQGELLKSEAAAIALRAERDAAMARVAELQAQVTECAEVLAYCRPSFPHIMGNDDWAIEQIKKQCELGERFDNLIVALVSGAESETTK